MGVLRARSHQVEARHPTARLTNLTQLFETDQCPVVDRLYERRGFVDAGPSPKDPHRAADAPMNDPPTANDSKRPSSRWRRSLPAPARSCYARPEPIPSIDHRRGPRRYREVRYRQTRPLSRCLRCPPTLGRRRPSAGPAASLLSAAGPGIRRSRFIRRRDTSPGHLHAPAPCRADGPRGCARPCPGQYARPRARR